MIFAAKMVLRLACVAALCLAFGVLWIMSDAGRGLRADVAASTERVAWIMQDRTRFGAGDPFAAEGFLLSAVKVMSPGICIDFRGTLYQGQRICSGWSDIGSAAPDWFSDLFQRFFYDVPATSRAIMLNGRQAGLIVTAPDPGAIVRRAWARVQLVVIAAAVTTLVTAILALLVVGQALLPAATLIGGLRRLQEDDYAARLPAFDQPEFGRVSTAFNDLADRLETARAERTALTRRLLQVQEDERRALARELHDEFGQCLTAIGALAASIDDGATATAPDLAFEARTIGDIVARMTATLRTALEQLRPPELDGLGLAGSLRHLVGVCNRRFGPKIQFRIETSEALPPLEEQTAIAIYRISQEGLTNAVRHGSPQEVMIRLDRSAEDAGTLLLTIEDDGASIAEREPTTGGRGILGMQERVGALGGRLNLGRHAKGFRVSASIPILEGTPGE